ncbi:MAG: dihydropteroate synthase [Bergeyella sp.]|nr:dihydropteroate synthase [Bergeyella sp.]
MRDVLFSSSFYSINCRGRLVDLSTPKIMGILNITPDSFSDGGCFISPYIALKQVELMLKNGAEVIDIGAQSTRPGAQKISADEEISRLGLLLPEIRKYFPEVLLSLDTFYGKVVDFGSEEGIDIINDISAGSFDPDMLSSVASSGLPYVLTHNHETYETMHTHRIEEDVVVAICRFFYEKTDFLKSLGIYDVIVDVGFGFGKSIGQQQQLIAELSYFQNIPFPMLVGISRKSFIYKPINKDPHSVGKELEDYHFKVLKSGAKILRVHDVKAARQTLTRFSNEL